MIRDHGAFKAKLSILPGRLVASVVRSAATQMLLDPASSAAIARFAHQQAQLTTLG